MNHDIAAALAKARQLAGDPSFNRIRDEVRDRIGWYTPTAETIRRMHSPDEVPTQKPMDIVVLAALAEFYGLSLDDLMGEGPEAQEVVRIRALLERALTRHNEVTGG